MCLESAPQLTVPRNRKARLGCSNRPDFTNKCELGDQETCSWLVRDSVHPLPKKRQPVFYPMRREEPEIRVQRVRGPPGNPPLTAGRGWG